MVELSSGVTDRHLERTPVTLSETPVILSRSPVILSRSPVILSRSEESASARAEILRFTQDDRRDLLQARSPVAFYPSARIRLIQFLFHKYGVDQVVAAIKDKKDALEI